MASFADRNRELVIARLEANPHLEGAKVRAAAALMRVSIFALIAAGVIGAIAGQLAFGEGGLQFGIGMVAGYAVYFGYRFRTMGEPRVIGGVAALTDRKLILIGSRKSGVVGEYNISDIESLEMLRRGNLLIMGKIGLTPVGGDRVTFFSTNRRMGDDLVEQFNEIGGRRAGST